MLLDASAHEIAQMVEFGEAEAYADLFRAATPDLGLTTERVETAVLFFAPQLDVTIFNRVLGVGLRKPATEALLDHTAKRYRNAGVRHFAIQLSPIAQPSILPAWCHARHLHLRDRWVKVYRPAGSVDPVPTDFRIVQIDHNQADGFAAVACTAFGMPPHLQPWLAATVGRPGWQHYAAFDGPQPVATGALFVYREVGWLGLGSTLPTHRRRGAQGAIMARRILDAATLGCRWVITETGEDTPDRPNPSFHNMLRTGFSVAYHRPNYMGE